VSERIPKSKLIDAWLLEKGYIAHSKNGEPYRTVGKGEARATALNSLLQTLLKNGYEEEDIDHPETLRMISEELMCEERKARNHRQNFEGWKKDIKRQWEHELREEFGQKYQDKVADAKARISVAPPAPVEDDRVWEPPPNKFLGTDKAKVYETNQVFDDSFLSVMDGPKIENQDGE
jgi:hypothetical protein